MNKIIMRGWIMKVVSHFKENGQSLTKIVENILIELYIKKN